MRINAPPPGRGHLCGMKMSASQAPKPIPEREASTPNQCDDRMSPTTKILTGPGLTTR